MIFSRLKSLSLSLDLGMKIGLFVSKLVIFNTSRVSIANTRDLWFFMTLQILIFIFNLHKFILLFFIFKCINLAKI